MQEQPCHPPPALQTPCSDCKEEASIQVLQDITCIKLATYFPRRHSIFSILPTGDNEDDEDSEVGNKPNTNNIDDDESDEEDNEEKATKLSSYRPSRKLFRNTPIALQPSTTSTDDLPLSTSGNG